MNAHDFLIWLALALLLLLFSINQWRRYLDRRIAKRVAGMPVVADGPAMTKREFRAALAVGEDHPLWRAVMQAIAVQQSEAMGETIDADTQLRPALLHYYAGASMHLLKLAEFLKDEREKAVANHASEGEDDE